MGQTLSEPVIDKHSTEDGNDCLIYGASSMQGWRVSMEDAHTTILKLDGSNVGFFAVYDGHGGQNVAKFSGGRLHKRIAAEDAFKKGLYPEAIKNGFLGTDVDLKQDPELANDPSGCTAVAAVIEPGKRVFVGNAGDSRAVISVNGKVEALSHDHKPVNKTESQRIVAAGGFVEFGRVNGNLALSRAIGDFEFKQNLNLSPEQQIVTSNPDIIEHKLGEDEEFIVLACDGIWDCMTSQEVVDFVRMRIAEQKDLRVICEELMDRCLAPDSEIGGIGCDNMTVVIVGLLNGLTRPQWYDTLSKRIQQGAATDRLGNLISGNEAGSASNHITTGNGSTSALASTAIFNTDDSDDYPPDSDEEEKFVGEVENVESRKDSIVSAPAVLADLSSQIQNKDR
ncbi:phosphatase 2C-like domain-containing protein [Endogone sp. FLAS-F59071]|nr:phosphatase 2C-like domain-containing protein [Endogone sp. FLAS-F59071]|eukprot:RUS23103.1 phosphatase 2C-like domain-containing protein [Endogone sp. FLAS-F59071]